MPFMKNIIFLTMVEENSYLNKEWNISKTDQYFIKISSFIKKNQTDKLVTVKRINTSLKYLHS